jgi:hypothetical protein
MNQQPLGSSITYDETYGKDMITSNNITMSEKGKKEKRGSHHDGSIGPPADKPKCEKYLSWNASSLQKRWDSGDLIKLLVRHDPTTITVSEIKTPIADFKDPTSLRHVLKSIGYAYCIFN